jgi:PIN domain nuclease of toxin-antitoxin system
LLLDTQALLWWLEDSPRLGRHAHDSMADPATAIWISAVSAWEIVIKIAAGRLRAVEAPEVSITREMDSLGFQPLPVTIPHALAVGSLPPHHNDPFDRMLIAQARSDGLTIVTSDSVFERYDVAVLDARR